MFEDIELHKILNGGRYENLPIASLDAKLGKLIGAKTDVIVLTPYTAKKQRFKHGQPGHLTLTHYRMIPLIINHGEVIHVPEKPRHLEFVYADDIVFDTNFIAVIKANRPGTELFLESFRKLEARRFNARVKRAYRLGHVIRYHKR